MDGSTPIRMRICKFQIHTVTMGRAGAPGDETKGGDELRLSARDFPDLKDGDIVEIYHVEDEFSRLLLQVKNTSFRADVGHNTISVEDSIAKTFQLRAYQNVIVNPVPFKEVELNLLELTLKDQYFSRSDMWRNRNALVGSCAHLHKKLEFGCGRTTVHEMWAKGGRVACGTIGENTKIVYRSMTANVYIFIQMSVEMWEFDHYGDLYFEKSIKGFLTDLFKKWQKQQANHDVTIVMFSRTFYEADSLEEFPCKMREGLLRDYKDRFYEDFYRIVVQNEKYDDWTFALIKLKTIFHSYNKTVLNFHNHPGVQLPRAYNSSASEGNVLEVLNMGLNVFEKHTVDRSFERTGQMCVVITPSTGVFEVDRELLTLTKQKSIDYGIGNDLVFMGEQPLHVVPLFILHNKRNWKKSGIEEPVDYAIPNWLNYSYYTSKDADPHVFVPRIRIPEKVLAAIHNGTPLMEEPAPTKKADTDEAPTPNRRKNKNTGKLQGNRPRGGRRLSESAAGPVNFAQKFLLGESRTQLASGVEAVHGSFLLSSSLETANPLRPNATKILENKPLEQPLSDQQRKPTKSPNPRHQRSLINPLAPSKIPVKLTSNRRRWVDIFPTDTSGAAVQTHHFRGTSHSEDAQNTLSKSPASDGARDTESPSSRIRPMEDGDRVNSGLIRDGDGDEGSTIEEEVGVGGSDAAVKSPRRIKTNRAASDVRGSPALSTGIWGNEHKKTIGTKKSYVWGITGEMEWSPNLTTGVDWKALTIPASLPITTDYLPDRRAIQNDYLVSDYSVLPEEPDMSPVNHAQGDAQEPSRYYSRPLSLRELYEELMCQRLQQGFQLISGSKTYTVDADFRVSEKISRKSHLSTQSEQCFLSLGRVFHRIRMDLSNITVTRFTPRHPYRIPRIDYKYRFMVPDMNRYEVSWVTFSHERFEEFNWNYLDFCILTKGRGDYPLEHPQMKCWKGQYFVLPCGQSIIKKISDDRSNSRCDIWNLFDRSPEEYDAMCDGFMRVIEMCNRMKRVQKGRKPNPAKRQPAPSRVLSLLGRSAHLNAISSPDLHGSQSAPTKNPSPLAVQYTCLEAFKAASNSLGLEVPSPQGSPARTSGLSVMSPMQDILEAMKASYENIVTSQKQTDLQPGFFLSYEAVEWAMENLGIPCSELASELFSRMITEGLIVHASGKRSFPFVCGFYLYNIVQPGETRHPIEMELEDCDINFDQVWIECAIANPAKGRLRFLEDRTRELDLLKQDHGIMSAEAALDRNNPYPFSSKKSCLINVDMYYRGSNRLEWAVANYHSTFTPDCAFEIELKWLQASGPMFGELMQVWGRRCPSNGFHLIPVPGDPFALPSKASSDPLRMPIFVPLQCDRIIGIMKASLHVEGAGDPRVYQKLVHMQEAILHRFGFISLQENARRIDVMTNSREYVHVSGGMFAMIPAHDNSKELEQLVEDCNTLPLAGYWWAWNNCLTKKWRSANTGDEAFLDKMLADFRRFCSNDESRLEDFWSEYTLETPILQF